MAGKPVVIVTGASRGIGAAIAAEFGRAGYFTCVHFHLKQRQAQEVLEQIRKAGGDGELVQFDIRETSRLNASLEDIAGRHGRIDVLVNNAGVLSDALFPLMTEQQWTEIMDTNVNGCFRCTHAVVPAMVRAGKGSIVNIASLAGTKGSPGQSNYAASKGAIISFTRTLAVELAPHGVRVNAVVPGFIAAGMTVRMNREIMDQKTGFIPMQRLGSADEVAGAVAFLASDRAGYITGQVLAVDGGLSA